MKETNHERERKEILPPVLSPWCRLCDVTPRVAPAQTARWWRLTEGHRGRISDQRKPRWGVPLPHILHNSQGPFSSPTSTLIQEAHACFNTYNNRFKRKKNDTIRERSNKNRGLRNGVITRERAWWVIGSRQILAAGYRRLGLETWIVVLIGWNPETASDWDQPIFKSGGLNRRCVTGSSLWFDDTGRRLVGG